VRELRGPSRSADTGAVVVDVRRCDGGVFLYDLLVHPNLPDEAEPTPPGSIVT